MRPTALALLCLCLLGCTSADHDMLERQLAELKGARDRGEISPSEYYKLKQQAEQAYGQRRATRGEDLETE